MPLHLLGKKSWNVYNQNNIATVRRDEAAAEVRRKEELRRIDEADAESRLQILRSGAAETRNTDLEPGTEERSVGKAPSPSKKSRLDDEEGGSVLKTGTADGSALQSSRIRQQDFQLTDQRGNINLFPDSDVLKAKRNAEVAADSRRKQRDLEDQYTMRFSNASGRGVGSDSPWYNKPATHGQSNPPAVSKDASSTAEQRRQDREKQRMHAADPLLMIKKGVKKLREVDKHREEWREQRERDLNEVEKLARKHARHKKRQHSDEESLENFDLNESRPDRRKRRHLSRRHHRRHRHDDESRKDGSSSMQRSET